MFFFFIGINSPQALKKILSLSEEGSLERHRKQAEDTISTASSQLSSPPTSPQSSPRKGRVQGLPSLRRSTRSVQRRPERVTREVPVLYAKDLMGCDSGFSSPVYKFGRMVLFLVL